MNKQKQNKRVWFQPETRKQINKHKQINKDRKLSQNQTRQKLKLNKIIHYSKNVIKQMMVRCIDRGTKVQK